MLVLGYAAPKPASCCCFRNITIALMLLVTGCRNQTEGIVVGRVTVSGQNLNRGVATLHGPNNSTVSASINNGEFRAERVPIGTVRITINSIPEMSGIVQRRPEDSDRPHKGAVSVPTPVSRSQAIPIRFTRLEDTPLEHKVKCGPQELRVELP
jgi:hypothetical protein